jgi:hypothetical protein
MEVWSLPNRCLIITTWLILSLPMLTAAYGRKASSKHSCTYMSCLKQTTWLKARPSCWTRYLQWRFLFLSYFGNSPVVSYLVIGEGGFPHARRPVLVHYASLYDILPVSIPYRYLCVPSVPTEPANSASTGLAVSIMLTPSIRGVSDYCWVGNVLEFSSVTSFGDMRFFYVP